MSLDLTEDKSTLVQVMAWCRQAVWRWYPESSLGSRSARPFVALLRGCHGPLLDKDPTLRWRHNGLDSVSNHQPHDCLLNRSFGRRSKETSKFRVTGLCLGNSPVTGEFPTQMASNVENVSIWWRRHEMAQQYSRQERTKGIKHSHLPPTAPPRGPTPLTCGVSSEWLGTRSYETTSRDKRGKIQIFFSSTGACAAAKFPIANHHSQINTQLYSASLIRLIWQQRHSDSEFDAL